jgi:hypothetical protein
MNGPKESPIFSAPADMQCSVGPMVCWFTRPPGIFFQLTEATRMTLAMASWAAGPAFQAMREHFAGKGSFYFLIDIRAMTERDPGVREAFMKLARDSGSQLSASVIIPPRRANPLYLGALQTASALLAPFGTKLEVTADLQRVIDQYRLHPAA